MALRGFRNGEHTIWYTRPGPADFVGSVTWLM